MYAVEIIRDEDGSHIHSRYFEKIAAARKWATWLRTLPWVREVRIINGGYGGEIVE